EERRPRDPARVRRGRELPCRAGFLRQTVQAVYAVRQCAGREDLPQLGVWRELPHQPCNPAVRPQPRRIGALAWTIMSAFATKRFYVLLAAALLITMRAPVYAVDQSPPPILQWFESSYRTVETRTPDLFMA